MKLESLAVKVKGNGQPQASIEDVGSLISQTPDGIDDLVVHILDDDLIFEVGISTATLTGELFDGTPFFGTGAICITQS